MGYFLDYCPILDNCCFSVPLRTASFIISIFGFFWAALYIYFFTSSGAGFLQDLGLPSTILKPIRYFHGLFGVLLCAVHVILFTAAIYKSDALCELYVWFLVVYLTTLVIIVVTVACVATVGENIAFACYFLFAMAFVVLISVYFAMIVANYRMTLP